MKQEIPIKLTTTHNITAILLSLLLAFSISGAVAVFAIGGFAVYYFLIKRRSD